MKKVAKKKSLNKKKNIQTNKKKKTKKNINTKNTKTIKKQVQNKSVNNTNQKTKKVSETNNKTEVQKEKKLSLTKSITIPKIKEDKKLSLTKSLTLPKLKLKKDNSLTKSITIPKIKEEVVKDSYVELDLFDDNSYKTAENLYKDKKYNEAYNIYYSLLEKYKKDKRLYKRLINTLTQDYTYKDNSKEFSLLFNDYVNTYKLLANKKEIKSLEYNLELYKNVKVTKRRSKFLLIAFLGFLGIHKFIEKKIIIGILYFFTLGFLGIGVLIDLINDYAEYEDTLQLDILRYIISSAILVVGILNRDLENFYLIIISAIIFLPIIYSFILKYIPGFIKVIGMIVLIYFGFQTEQIVEYVPNTIIGDWTTINESTNFEDLKISSEKTIITFDDREEESGTNEYDSKNRILRIIIDDTKSYKFIINIEESKICSYNESKECLIEFNKKEKTTKEE